MPLLTIAIPTFNRATNLERTLDIIGAQIAELRSPNVCELLVSDNASTDTTSDVCVRFQLKYPNVPFSHHINPTNVGFDKNVDTAVSRSTGKYVWTLSDDDNPHGNAVSTILSELADNDLDPEFIFVNYHVQTNGVTIPSRAGVHSTVTVPGPLALQTIQFANSFLSSCIFRRATWTSSNPERFYGTFWIHFYMAAAVTRRGSSLLILEPLLTQIQPGLERSRAERRSSDPHAIDFFINAHLSFIRFSQCLATLGHEQGTINAADTLARNDEISQIVSFKLTTPRYSIVQLTRTAAAIAPFRRYELSFWFLKIPLLLAPSYAFKVTRRLRQMLRRRNLAAH